MAQQINPQTVAALRAMKKTAIIVLLMFNLAGPVSAERVAELLDIDYQTTRKYLKELSLLGVVSKTPVGWILLQGGAQLILPTGEIFDQKRDFRDAIIAPESPSPSPAPAACPTPFHLQEEEEKEEEIKARFSRVSLCLATLEELGITATAQVLAILQDERITPAYIDAQAERLEHENRWSTGLLLTVIKSFDPIPLGSKAKRKRDNMDGRNYVEGPYKSFIES